MSRNLARKKYFAVDEIGSMIADVTPCDMASANGCPVDNEAVKHSFS
jgi:hypothetical protein